MTTKERLEELFNDNENYIHSYTGTTMIDTEKVVPKILTMMSKPIVSGALPPTYTVTRVEVIDEAGRSYINWHNKNCVEVQLQDESRTMKIFISRRQ